MIRLIRIFSVFLFIVSVALFVFSGIHIQKGKDTKGPVIHMSEDEIAVSIDANEEDMLQGITAEDNKDGDVTASLMIEKMDMFFEKGKRKITIDAFDSNNNVAKAERVIVYDDYISPRISLKGPLRVSLNDMDAILNIISVEDCLEGNITDNLQITPVENITAISRPGEYAMKIIVSNDVGDVVEMPVTVEVYDYIQEGMKPEILLTEYLVYTSVGQPVDPQEYLKGVRTSDAEYDWSTVQEETEVPYNQSEVVIDNPVDVQKPGTYEVVYSLTNGTSISKVRLIVVVE